MCVCHWVLIKVGRTRTVYDAVFIGLFAFEEHQRKQKSIFFGRHKHLDFKTGPIINLRLLGGKHQKSRFSIFFHIVVNANNKIREKSIEM